MRRDIERFPVRRDLDRGLSAWTDSSLLNPSSLLSASPWQMMQRMQEDIDRLFGQVFETGPQQLRQWSPSVDISQDDREWLIEVDLPGVSKDQIDVQVHNQYLVLRAELRQEEEPATEGQPQRQYQRRERRYGYFERVLPLPQNVDEEQIQCDFQDGVLKLHLPKVEQPQPRGRRIPIGDGASRPASLEAHAETDTGTTGAAPTAQAAEGLENNAAESGKQSRTTRSRGKGKEEAGAA